MRMAERDDRCTGTMALEYVCKPGPGVEHVRVAVFLVPAIREEVPCFVDAFAPET